MSKHHHIQKHASQKHSGKLSRKPPTRESRDTSKSPRNADTHLKIEGDLPSPTPQAYFGKDLSLALQRNAKTKISTRLNFNELSFLKRDIPAVSSKHTHDTMALLKAYFVIFNKAFFFGLLSQELRDSIEIFDDKGESGRSGYYHNGIIKINKYISERPGSLAEMQVTVLLREMLHAFLDCYACRCHKCQQRTAAQGGYGASGHGSTWCNAMMGLESGLAREVEWAGDCGIAAGIEQEMSASDWQPRAGQLERWRVEPEELTLYRIKPQRPMPTDWPRGRGPCKAHHIHKKHTKLPLEDCGDVTPYCTTTTRTSPWQKWGWG